MPSKSRADNFGPYGEDLVPCWLNLMTDMLSGNPAASAGGPPRKGET
jgi:hypothetical protein